MRNRANQQHIISDRRHAHVLADCHRWSVYTEATRSHKEHQLHYIRHRSPVVSRFLNFVSRNSAMLLIMSNVFQEKTKEDNWYLYISRVY